MVIQKKRHLISLIHLLLVKFPTQESAWFIDVFEVCSVVL